MDWYRIVYRRDGRLVNLANDRTAISVTTGGIVIHGGTANDTLKITRLVPRQLFLPPITRIDAPSGLRLLACDAPVREIVSAGPIARMTLRGAVDAIQVDQAGSIRVNASTSSAAHVHIAIAQPFAAMAGRPSLPTDIQLVGLGLAALEAPEVDFSRVRSASKIYAAFDRGVLRRFISRGALGDGAGAIAVGSIGQLVAAGGPIHVDAITGAIPVIRADGMTARLDGQQRVALEADITVNVALLSSSGARISATGGDIPGGAFLVDGPIHSIQARRIRLVGAPVGGFLGVPGGPSHWLTVVAGLDQPAPSDNGADIVAVVGHGGINGAFHAGGAVDPDTGAIIPLFTGALRQVHALPGATVDGVITMSPSRRPTRFPAPGRGVDNHITVVTE